MPDIRHRVGIDAPAATVYEAIATPEGLSAWWTRDVRGEGRVGSALAVHFGSDKPGAVMDVTELDPERRVTWRCSSGAPEWIGTEIRFELKPGVRGETVVLFTHADWREPVEFMHHCSIKWAQFLISLKHGLESGTATPFPEDEHISIWR
ncbi:MAG TPA: SRPBCC domain-containing protein [Miltoncostaeaceae bacterium]|nr:SRPBCC domain-containing protein [Miltoncostaeaceae bacterium]